MAEELEQDAARPVMDGRGVSWVRLAALGAHLAARRFQVDLTRDGLKVVNPNRRGCCDDVRHASDTISCRSRRDDGGRQWYFTVRREAPCHIPGSAGRNLEGVPGSDDLPGFER